MSENQGDITNLEQRAEDGQLEQWRTEFERKYASTLGRLPDASRQTLWQKFLEEKLKVADTVGVALRIRQQAQHQVHEHLVAEALTRVRGED